MWRRMSVTAESLLREYFLPLYPEDTLRDLASARSEDANPGENPSFLRHLDEAADTFAKLSPAVFETELLLDGSDASVHRLSVALTRARRDRWMAEGKGTPDSELFNLVVHGAAYVGRCIVKNHGGVWAVRRPLWESVVHLHSNAGDGDLAPFHWWLKALADDALDGHVGALADRYRTYVEVPKTEPTTLPVIAPVDRRLPKLSKVRYDALYKYLRAHLPELKDVGEHFPTGERLEELRLSALEFFLVGEGRMLVMAGAGAAGLHLFWLSASGFEKAAFIPCESFPAPKVDLHEGKVRAMFSVEQKTTVQEFLWWGP